MCHGETQPLGQAAAFAKRNGLIMLRCMIARMAIWLRRVEYNHTLGHWSCSAVQGLSQCRRVCVGVCVLITLVHPRARFNLALYLFHEIPFSYPGWYENPGHHQRQDPDVFLMLLTAWTPIDLREKYWALKLNLPSPRGTVHLDLIHLLFFPFSPHSRARYLVMLMWLAISQTQASRVGRPGDEHVIMSDHSEATDRTLWLSLPPWLSSYLLSLSSLIRRSPSHALKSLHWVTNAQNCWLPETELRFYFFPVCKQACTKAARALTLTHVSIYVYTTARTDAHALGPSPYPVSVSVGVSGAVSAGGCHWWKLMLTHHTRGPAVN